MTVSVKNTALITDLSDNLILNQRLSLKLKYFEYITSGNC